MADHQHVEVLVDRVDRVGPGRVGAGGKNIGLAGDLDDVRRVAAAGAFRVVTMDGPPFDGADRVVDEAGLVERVGVDGDLDIHGVGNSKAVVDGGGGGAPVLVQFQPAGAGLDLILEKFGQAAVISVSGVERKAPRIGMTSDGLQRYRPIAA